MRLDLLSALMLMLLGLIFIFVWKMILNARRKRIYARMVKDYCAHSRSNY